MPGHASKRPALPPDPGSDQRARPRASRDGAADDRSSRRGVRGAGARSARGTAAGVQDQRTGHRSSRRPPRARGRRRSSTRCRPATRCCRSRSASSRGCGRSWRGGSGSRSTSCLATGRAASIRRLSRQAEEDREHRIRAVLVVHNETSTGVTSRLAEIRQRHRSRSASRLLLVDAVSSLASIDLRHDEWGIDVTLSRVAEGADAAAGHRASTRSARRRSRRRSGRACRSRIGRGSR